MILISEFMDEAAVAALSAVVAVDYAPDLANDRDALVARVAGAAALIVRNRTRVDADLLAAASQLQCVGRLGVGLDNVDVEAAKARGVAVYPATGANDRSVAEYVIGTAMSLMRGAYHRTDDVMAGDWPRTAAVGREIAGKTLGLVGFGSTARETARLGRAVGMTAIATDALVSEGDARWSEARRTDLPSLLTEADVVSLHVPLTDATRNLVGARELASMKAGAIIINAARGGVVDEAALIAELKIGRLGGAALDVFPDEPLTAQAGARFADLPNLLLTPHIAGVTAESNVRVSALIATKVAKHLALKLGPGQG